jgi:hypothetical protein
MFYSLLIKNTQPQEPSDVFQFKEEPVQLYIKYAGQVMTQKLGYGPWLDLMYKPAR